MKSINIHEAKTQLSKLVKHAHAGDEIVISKAGVPYAKLVPFEIPKKRQPGIAKGAVTKHFFEPLPEDELNGWN